MTICTKNDPSGTTATISRRVPQGCSSSPDLYNVYMDSCPVSIEDSLQFVQTSDPAVDGDVGVFADDFKLQASSAEVLQVLLDSSTAWASERGMTWSIQKCHVMEPENSMPGSLYELAGSHIEVTDSASYLGVTLQHDTVGVQKPVERARSACKRINLLRAVGFHRKSLSSFQLINICRTYVYPLADYAMHLVPTSGTNDKDLVEALNELDHRVAEYALGCIQKEPQRMRPSEVVVGGRLPRHLKIARLPNWQQRARLRLAGLARRLKKRATLLRWDLRARADPRHLQVYRSHLSSPTDLSERGLNRMWSQLCTRRVRKIPIPDKGLLPILHEKDAAIRDSGIRYYTGAFPRLREVLRAALGSTAYEEGKRRLQAGMSAEV